MFNSVVIALVFNGLDILSGFIAAIKEKAVIFVRSNSKTAIIASMSLPQMELCTARKKSTSHFLQKLR